MESSLFSPLFCLLVASLVSTVFCTPCPLKTLKLDLFLSVQISCLKKKKWFSAGSHFGVVAALFSIMALVVIVNRVAIQILERCDALLSQIFMLAFSFDALRYSFPSAAALLLHLSSLSLHF